MRNPQAIRLAVVLPSRGLVFSKTVEELYRELDGLDFKIFWSHGRPIPDCFEIPTREALKDKSFTHLLTIEEDMIIPKGAVKKMLSKRKEAVAYDYPVTGSPSGTVLYDMDGTAFFTGCGILLVEMDIVRRMVFPIWRVDIAWGMKLFADRAEFDIKPGRKEDYGQQDIAFGLRLYVNNIPLHVVGETGQRKLIKRGEGMTNQGSHEIVEYSDVSRQDYLNGTTSVSSFMEIEIDGKTINMYKPDAEKLIAEGKAKSLNIRNARFNNLESIKDWVWLKSS
jgi:hypothetical protein